MKHLKKYNESKEYSEMNSLFATWDIALKLKEMGFDEPCLAKFALRIKGQKVPDFLNNFEREGLWFRHNSDPRHKDMNDPNSIWSAPLWQQCILWLNKNHGTDFSYDGNIRSIENEIKAFLENF